MKTTKAILFACAAMVALPALPAAAEQLDVPVMEHADEFTDTCAWGKIKGLKADGDGFLAVRSGPGSTYRKLDELHNDDPVWIFDKRGKWIGIVYDTPGLSCNSTVDRPVPYDGRKGWVHENWVDLIAG
ncbi:MAG: SH3 domain-containing protein [Hyphomicrobiales bacterium]|nr:MAG: SH3 domain-containing protein [Hyphomicrobiales bacterium]